MGNSNRTHRQSPNVDQSTRYPPAGPERNFMQFQPNHMQYPLGFNGLHQGIPMAHHHHHTQQPMLPIDQSQMQQPWMPTSPYGFHPHSQCHQPQYPQPINSRYFNDPFAPSAPQMDEVVYRHETRRKR
ncbi:hypothetical protein ACOME3_003203 [Neoechinorhynchus agilis]